MALTSVFFSESDLQSQISFWGLVFPCLFRPLTDGVFPPLLQDTASFFSVTRVITLSLRCLPYYSLLWALVVPNLCGSQQLALVSYRVAWGLRGKCKCICILIVEGDRVRGHLNSTPRLGSFGWNHSLHIWKQWSRCCLWCRTFVLLF